MREAYENAKDNLMSEYIFLLSDRKDMEKHGSEYLEKLLDSIQISQEKAVEKLKSMESSMKRITDFFLPIKNNKDTSK